MTARVRFVLIAGVALVLVVPVLAFFLARLVLSHDALLLDHVSERRTTLVELSLWAGADPNYRDDGRSALPLAVELADSEIVQMLLDAGADANGRDAEGAPVLASAAAGGNAWVVGLLLDAGADPNGQDAEGAPVMAAAVGRGDPRVVGRLLDAGADPNSRDAGGIPVLATAAIADRAEVVKLLLDAGSDPNSLAHENLSVLAIAVDRGHTEVAQLLLDAGADPNGPGIAELVQQSGNADLLALLEAGALTAEALLTLAELGLFALGNIDKFIEGMICIFTLGFGC